jgi:hypothetical protein
MGLGITVGILADLLEHDEEGAEWISEQLYDVNKLLQKEGLQQHVEPTNCEVWSVDGYGYSGLHALREVAGFFWKGIPISKTNMLTGNDRTNSDILFDAAIPQLMGEKSGGFFARILGKKTLNANLPFLHLVCHSDAEGFYVPVDFPVPITPKVIRDETASIWPLGSVQQLNQELDVLIHTLEIPIGMNSQSDELFDAIESKERSKNDSLWHAQPIASYSALILKEACVASLKTGAAISFG